MNTKIIIITIGIIIIFISLYYIYINRSISTIQPTIQPINSFSQIEKQSNICNQMQTQYGIIPSVTYGSANTTDQLIWNVMDCNILSQNLNFIGEWTSMDTDGIISMSIKQDPNVDDQIIVKTPNPYITFKVNQNQNTFNMKTMPTIATSINFDTTIQIAYNPIDNTISFAGYKYNKQPTKQLPNNIEQLQTNICKELSTQYNIVPNSMYGSETTDIKTIWKQYMCDSRIKL
jgi:hypothetical protein